KQIDLCLSFQASFACLATRVPTGTPLSTELLNRIETAETVLKDSGFHQYRARHHGNLCRIEIEPEEFPRLLDPALRQQIITAIQYAGYTYVTLDLKGYGRH
ncbi:MAG TPA: TIGR00268 family protein, partial [Candidatus Hydrogenedentes bacterium]|nr:TIGR00268 family protein [Candidatus Hydrogenedentota bacterium]